MLSTIPLAYSLSLNTAEIAKLVKQEMDQVEEKKVQQIMQLDILSQNNFAYDLESNRNASQASL